MPSPTNTMATPTHCLAKRGLPKRITEARMVKNLRVVVIIDVVRGPKVVTVRKMKFWKEKTIVTVHVHVGKGINKTKARETGSIAN